MQTESIKRYLASSIKTPFFLFVSDGHYVSARDELSLLGFEVIRLSEFCSGDKLPDIDGLFSGIISARHTSMVVTGLGEYLALRGNDEAVATLSWLKDINVGSSKIVFLLRGLASQISVLQTDLRFDNRRFCVIDKADCDLSLTLVEPSVGLSALKGFKAILAELESGRYGRVVVSTAINLDKALFTVHKISHPYQGVKFFARDFALPSSCGSETRWAELLTELNESNGSLEDVFEKNELSGNLDTDFYARVAGNDYCSWLYFIFLKYKTDTLSNGYLRFVLERTSRFEDFVENVLNEIIEIQHSDGRFVGFYRERKVLVEKFPESDIAHFVVNNRKVVSESIYKLTDVTQTEREEIIAWIAQNGMIKQIESVYPALAAYAKRYVFKGTVLAELLTDYFDAYKRQKILNKLEPEFLAKVDELAFSPRIFNRLPTRNEIIDEIDKVDTFLYWLDALGVEYLALIEHLVQKRGLAMRVCIARAELPTITSINRNFFDDWQGGKEKCGELDDIKHNADGGYNFTNNELPIHLAKELSIIEAMIDKASTDLALRHCKRFLIVSDHGASRLAVLRRKEEKYDSDTKGEHSGRCCQLFQQYDIPFAAEENGYLVLADYGRFKGSRAANVEVHGGASLEEVVVPIIELSLKNRDVTVKLVEDVVLVDFRNGMEFTLFFNSPVLNVSVVLNGKPHSATQTDANHYNVKLPGIRRAGVYPADVYAGDNMIGKITIKAQGKSGKVNDAFDDLL